LVDGFFFAGVFSAVRAHGVRQDATVCGELCLIGASNVRHVRCLWHCYLEPISADKLFGGGEQFYADFHCPSGFRQA
jgi:hypothetical protein